MSSPTLAECRQLPQITRFHRSCYAGGRLVCAFIRFQCVRVNVLNLAGGTLDGGYQLAVTHLSHLEPVVVGLLVRRYIRWMSRIEFFKYRIPRAMLHALGVFSVNRQGVPVQALRTAIEEVNRGGVVGIFPEGGVKIKQEAVIRGGRMKRGVCMIAQYTGRPVVPVVVLGTEKLNRVAPWLPFRWGQVWVAFGEPIHPPAELPPPGPARRAARAALAEEIEAAFRENYNRLLRTYDLPDARFP